MDPVMVTRLLRDAPHLSEHIYGSHTVFVPYLNFI